MSPIFAFLFGSPLAALGAGLGALSIPIVIHLLSRRRYRVVDWAAMRFLLAAQKQNIRKMRLEQFILLAVRTTLMLLLVLAMVSAMPWAEALWQRFFPASAALASVSSQRTHKILVLDASLSMALKRGDKTCFELAKDRAGELIELSPSGDGFSVVLLSAPPQRIVGETAEDPRRVADEVRGLRVTHGNADLAATLNTVEDILRRSPAKFEAREVVFLTDLQRATWLGFPVSESKGPTASAETMLRLQQQARLVFVDVGQDGVGNLAVTNLALGSALATTGATTPIVATLHHYGEDEPRPATVEFLVGKARETAADPAFQLRLIGQEVVTVPAGRAGASVTFTHTFATPGTYILQVRTAGDDLEPDDSRAIVVTVKDAVPVMLVNGRPAGDLYDQATEFLRDALNPFQDGLIPNNVPARPRVISEATFNDAALGDLTPYDCVFLCDVARLGTPEVRRLEAHLRRGGGVVFCLGPQVDLEAYNRVIYRDGQGILPARLLGKERAPAGRYFTLYADEESYKKPPLAAFVGDKDRTVLQAVSFQQYIRAELPGTSAGEKAGGLARKVMSFMPDPQPAGQGEALPVGEPAIIEWPKYRGRVILITTTVNSNWTTWPKLPSFPVLMQELVRFGVAGRLKEQAALVGEPIEEYLPLTSANLVASFRTPDQRTLPTQSQVRDDATLLRFTDTDQSGIYLATVGQHPQERLFAVNVPTATDQQQGSESDLARVHQIQLQDAYPGWNFQVVTDPRQIDRSAVKEDPDRTPTSRGLGAAVARVLLWLMLFLLLFETMLAWRLGHHSKSALPSNVPVAESPWPPIVVAVTAGLAFLVLAGVLLHTAVTNDFLGFLPDGVRGRVETALGVPQPVAGESTHWRLDSSPYLPVRADLLPWVLGALTIGALTLVMGVYFREGRTAPAGYRALLAGLRIFLVLLVLFVLLPQLQLWFERQGWPDVAIVIDDSKSMSAVDNYQDLVVKEAAARLSVDLPTPQRLQLAQALLARPDGGRLRELLLERKVKLHVFRCANRTQRIADVTEPEEIEAGAAAIRELQAAGDQSRLGDGIREVLEGFRGASLSAIILLSDGVSTEGEDLAQAARHAGQQGVPLYLVGIGDWHEPRDLILHDLQAEDTVFVNDRLVFEARLTAQGYANLPPQPVVLYEKGKDGQLKELARQLVAPDPAGKQVKFRLMHQPGEAGERHYVIDVPAQADEPQPTDNNRIERLVFVREAKPIRVLYIEGFPRQDYRYIKPLLEREQSDAKGKKTVELQVLLLQADDDFPSQDRSARSEFPTKEELNQFDVVLLGDVDPKHIKLGERNLKLLADFVRERGGGLLVLAGEHHGIRGWKDSPLADVLPIQVLDAAGAEAADRQWPQSFRPQLTPVGRLHPIFRFTPDEAENIAIWGRLAELYWYASGFKLQPAAEVLAVHPTAKTADPKHSGDGRQPLVVQHFVGAGRCMFMGIEDTWRWAFREDLLRFNQFWLQTIRHLARGGLGRIELRLDRQTPYRRGEPIHIMVRFPDDAPPPDPSLSVKVVLERAGLKGQDDAAETEVQTLSLTKLDGSRASYETLLTRTPAGEYRFWLSAPPVVGAKPRAECKVLPPPGEMERLRMNRLEMERAAAETRGKFYTLASVGELIEDLPSGQRLVVSAPSPPWSLWNHVATYGLVLGLVASEWILRKRKHLL